MLLLGMQLAGYGQAHDSVSVTVSFHIPVMQSLTIENSPNFASSFSASEAEVVDVYRVPKPTQEDLSKGYLKEKDAVTLSARSNVDWEIQVEAARRYMGTSDDGEYRKPVSDLEVKADGGNYVAASTASQVIARGEKGKHSVEVDYKVNLDSQEYRSGDYQATLTYIISTRE